MNVPPRRGFSSFGPGGYNHVAFPELKNGSSAAARTAALNQWQCTGEGNPISYRMDTAKAVDKA